MINTPSINGMSHLNTPFDPEIDSFLDFESNDLTPLSTPDTKVPSLSHQSSSNSNFFASSSTQQGFSKPSFQYDQYRQQIGLPAGGLANTFALNQASGLVYHDTYSGFVMPTETLNIPLSKLDDFDFARNSSLDMSDMDFDADSPSDMPAMFFPNGGSGHGQFVNPNTLVDTASAPVQRIYPGMHSQQAAQAKAQKQQEMMKQQQPIQIAGQKSLPSSQKNATGKDPVVEESISRLLSQMRQNSVASTVDDDSASANGMGNLPRIKKDEDEMDEDERLLASEEGKKLSSKERRQLRNKVSARAFRSRRKEYIGQLEGELATKVKEANDLRVENRQLREENTRLTDLTRMLLSSNAFSSFLEELSQSGGNGASALQTTHVAQQQSQSQPQSQPRQAPKDVNPHRVGRQMQSQPQQQIGMALMPEVNVDMSLFETPSWNSVLSSNDYQVFAVTALPEAPVFDLEKIIEKPVKSLSAASKTLKDVPTCSEIPFAAIVEPAKPAVVDENVSLNETTFTLYFDRNATTGTSEAQNLTYNHNPKLTVFNSTTLHETGSGESLEALCSSLDEISKKVSEFLPRDM